MDYSTGLPSLDIECSPDSVVIVPSPPVSILQVEDRSERGLSTDPQTEGCEALRSMLASCAQEMFTPKSDCTINDLAVTHGLNALFVSTEIQSLHREKTGRDPMQVMAELRQDCMGSRLSGGSLVTLGGPKHILDSHLGNITRSGRFVSFEIALQALVTAECFLFCVV